MFGSLPLSYDSPQPLPSMQQQPFPELPQVAIPKKRGMFGGAKIDLGGAIAGYLAASGIPGGAQMLQAINQRRAMEQQQAIEESQYNRKRADDNSDWMAQYNYKLQHPEPDDFTQLMTQAGVDPNSEQGKTLYLQYLQNKANPFQAVTVTNADGSQSREFMRPPQIPTSPVGKLTPLGAGGPGASPGGFQY